jgi:uncharacterized membrane protein
MSGGGAQQVTAQSYYDMIQHIYVAYFGRPADPDGELYFANGFLGIAGPTAIRGVSEAYSTNAAVAGYVDIFGKSQESADLYPGATSVFVNAVYRNLFNRDAEQAGLDYWAGLIDAGAISKANAAISIMAGAQGTDADTITKKVQVAAAFTAAASADPQKKAAYAGLAANAVVRTMLAGVTATTDVAAFASTIDATFNQLTGGSGGGTDYYAAVAPIIQQRCAGCHSAHPTIAGYNPAPLGIMFDTSDQIHAMAQAIYDNVVSTHNMPYANMTHMTDAERQTVATWFTHGAP